MKKRDSKLIAKLLLAQLGFAVDGNAFGESYLSENEINEIIEELHKMCHKLEGDHDFRHGATVDIVDYVLKRN